MLNLMNNIYYTSKMAWHGNACQHVSVTINRDKLQSQSIPQLGAIMFYQVKGSLGVIRQSFSVVGLTIFRSLQMLGALVTE